MTSLTIREICRSRLLKWAHELAGNHATPVLVVGVGHDHASGEVHVVCTEDMTEEEVSTFMRAALRLLEDGQAKRN